MPAAEPIDLEALKTTVLENFRANTSDQEAYDEWESHRNEHARPFPMDSPIPKAPPLNPDGSEKEEPDVRESEEPWLAVPDDVLGLLVDVREDGEPGFTGEITDKLGRKIKFVNGKRVKGVDKAAGGKTTFRARLNGEKVHVISHDSEHGLVSVKGADGKVKVVKTDELDFDRGKPAKQQQEKPAKEPSQRQEPAQLYTPDPTAINPQTGLADKARVGVPAMSVPPPPAEIGRLPNLDPKQRKAESRFAEAYLADPDGMAEKYLKALKKRKVGEYPNVFATDDVKMLNPDWNPAGAGNLGAGLPENVKTAMAQNNAAVHQTANAIAKRAFVKYLDQLPDGKKSVLVICGGCASGKGSSLARSTKPDDAHFGMLPASEQVGAIWDSAGEQNATENEWVLDECKKRGIKATFAYVWADPKSSWDGDETRGVIRRALRKGRMVDARLFADSYAQGAKNMKAFADKHQGEADFIYLDNRDKKAPKLLPSFPEETLKWDAEEIYKDAVAVLQKRKDELGPAIVAGGMGGTKIWGAPK